MAGSYTAGSLLVRVLPDARGAAAKVRKEMSGIPDERVKVDADIKAAEKEIEKVRAALAALEARKNDPKIDLDISAMEAKLAQATAKLEDLKRRPTSPKVDADILAAQANVDRVSYQLEQLNAKKADPKVDLDIANARAKIAGLDTQLTALRAKKAEIKADVDTGGAVAKLLALKAMAGGLLHFEGKVDLNTDPAVVRLVRLAGALGSLAMPAALIGALPFLASLGSSAVQAAGGLALIPAAAVTGAVAIGALKVATSGVGDALKYAFDPTKAKQFGEALAKLSPEARASVLAIQGLKGPIDALKTSTQDALFDGLAPMIKGLGSTYLPIAEERFNRIAGAVNFAGTSFGTWLGGAQAVGLVKTAGDGAASTFENLLMAVSPLLIAFVRIAAIGAPILAELTKGAAGVAQRFADWTGSAQGVQTITGWIRNAITVVKQLWQLAMNLGSILGSVFGAGARSGESFLSVLVRLTGSLAAALKTPEGSAGLQSFFTIVRQLVESFAEKLVILWPAIVAAGQAIGALLQSASPLTGVFLQLLVMALVPLLNLLTTLAPVLGPVLAVFLAVRVATGLWAATIGTLLSSTGSLVMAAARFGLLGAAAQTAALTGEVSAGRMVVSWLKVAAASTVSALKIAGSWLLTAGANAAAAVASTVTTVATIVGRWAWMAITATGHALRVAGLWLLTTGASAATAVASMAVTVAQFLLQWGILAAQSVAKALVTAGAWALTTGAAAATALATMAVTAAAYVASWVVASVGAMANAVVMAAAWFVALGPIGWVIAAVVGLVALIVTNWDTVKNITSTVWTFVTSMIQLGWSQITSIVSAGASAVSGFVSGCVDAVLGFFGRLAELPGKIGAWFGGMVSAALAKGAELLAWAAGVPGRILAALGQLGSLLLGVGRDLVNGLWNGIKAGWDWLTGMVKDLATTLLNAAKSALGIASPSKLFRDEVGAFLPAGAAVGVEANTSQAVAAVRGMSQDLASEAQVGLGAVSAPTLMWSGTGLEQTPAVTAQLSRLPAQLGALPGTLTGLVTDLDTRLTGGVDRLTGGMRSTLIPVRTTLVETGAQLVTTGAQLVDSGARIDGAATAMTGAATSIQTASGAIGRASTAIQSASSAITAATRQPAAPAAPAASRASGGGRMVRAEDGSMVPASYYYDSGGIASGVGVLVKGTRADERVLSPTETASYDRLGAVAAHLEAGRVATPPVGLPAAQLAGMAAAPAAAGSSSPTELQVVGGRVDVGNGFGELVDLKLAAVAVDINAGRQS